MSHVRNSNNLSPGWTSGQCHPRSSSGLHWAACSALQFVLCQCPVSAGIPGRLYHQGIEGWCRHAFCTYILMSLLCLAVFRFLGDAAILQLGQQGNVLVTQDCSNTDLHIDPSCRHQVFNGRLVVFVQGVLAHKTDPVFAKAWNFTLPTDWPASCPEWPDVCPQSSPCGAQASQHHHSGSSCNGAGNKLVLDS